MHPDQHTPDGHRTQEPDSLQQGQAPPAHAPDRDQRDDAHAVSAERGATEVSTHEPVGTRTGEAGNSYTGRQMDDDLQRTSRVDDARDVTGTASGTQRVHPDDPAEGAPDAV